MSRHALLATACLFGALAACSESQLADPQSDVPTAEQLVKQAVDMGMIRITVPDPDPGIPAYARAFPGLNQFFHDGDWLAIPFYRNPDAIPADFNLLDFFHFPGAGGPGAFATPILTRGFHMIEPNAPIGTFPMVAISSGTSVPVWFVKWSAYQPAMADNVVNIAELRAMNPLKGVASTFSETLKPRVDAHLVVINAKGALADGRTFDLHVTHVGDTLRAIRIKFGR